MKLNVPQTEKIGEYYIRRIQKERINMCRIKKLYNNKTSFNSLMKRLIEKDYNNFIRLTKGKRYGGTWRILYVILNIVQEEGKPIEPFDVMTKSYPSRTLSYYGWIFSWVHGDDTIISIYNSSKQLIYRF